MDIYAFFILFLTTISLAADSSISTDAKPSATTSSKSSTTSSAPAKTHTVQVGNGDHKFKPDVTKADIGDTIEFQFFPSNHSVVRAEYQYPCIPYEMTGPSKQGFWSDFHPVDAILPDPPKYQIKINDTDPIFFYCSAPGSCTDWGMVGVINPNASTSINTQRDLALNSSYSLNPGEPFPAESPLPSNLPSPTSPTQPSHPSNAPGTKHDLSSGAIAGIVVAGISVFVLAALLCFFIGRSNTLKEEMCRKSSTIQHTTPPSPSPFFTQSPNPQPQTQSTNCRPNIPPVYFQSPKYTGFSPPVPAARNFASPRTNAGASAGGNVNRSASHRSVGGTFDVSPMTGYYTRTHDGEDTYKFATQQTSEMGPPNTTVNWRNEKDVEAGFGGAGVSAGMKVPLGPYGRQQVAHGVWRGRGYAVNEGRPAEIDGSPVTFSPPRGMGAGNPF